MPALFKESLNPHLQSSSLLEMPNRPKTVFHVVRWMDPFHTTLLRQYHGLRKQVFVDTLEWDLSCYDGMEWDQYDTPQTVNILTEENGKCIGGCRLMRCDMTHKVGEVEYSYLLRDAFRGMIREIPSSVITYAPTASDEWEMTRAISGRDPRQFRQLLGAAGDYVRAQGGKYCMFISRPSSLRLGAIWGYQIEAMGPITRIGNSDWLAVRCKVG
jgi:acyl homoserine lactone synthase